MEAVPNGQKEFYAGKKFLGKFLILFKDRK